MSHLLHVFLLTSLHELTPIIDAYQWNAHNHFEQTIQNNRTNYDLHYLSLMRVMI